MSELSKYGIDETTLRQMYEEWHSGTPKSTLEARYLGKSSSHGKVFTGLVRRYLGIETERRSSLASENKRLRALLEAHGIDPDSDPSAGRALDPSGRPGDPPAGGTGPGR